MRMKRDNRSGGQSDKIAGFTVGGDLEPRNVGDSKKLEETKKQSPLLKSSERTILPTSQFQSCGSFEAPDFRTRR